MRKLAIIGASGHGKVIADIARKNGYKEIVLDKIPDYIRDEIERMLLELGTAKSETGEHIGLSDPWKITGNNSEKMKNFIDLNFLHSQKILGAMNSNSSIQLVKELLESPAFVLYNRQYMMWYYGDLTIYGENRIKNLIPGTDVVNKGIDYYNCFHTFYHKLYAYFENGCTYAYPLLEFDLFTMCDLVYSRQLHKQKEYAKIFFSSEDEREGMFDLLEGKEQHCEFDGVETVLDENGRYCCVPVTHKATLGEIVDLLEEFKSQPISLMMPKCPDGSFAKKLFSLYLTYLPTDKFKYAMKMNCDDRGSFTELVHTVDCGQVSINISKPGITKGQHWHNSKWEQFIVVHGHGLIQERNINTGETIEFEVSGDKIEAIYMIPGWTHNIINLSETEDLVTVMTCNEVFDPGHPDTFFEPV